MRQKSVYTVGYEKYVGQETNRRKVAELGGYDEVKVLLYARLHDLYVGAGRTKTLQERKAVRQAGRKVANAIELVDGYKAAQRLSCWPEDTFHKAQELVFPTDGTAPKGVDL
jgi:hypothetical protein